MTPDVETEPSAQHAASASRLLPTHLPDPVSRAFFRFALRALFTLLGGMVVRGVGNVPRTGPVLFCPNHISDSDPALIYAANPRSDTYYMGKQELFEMCAGRFFRYHGGFPVRRNSADRTALRTASRLLGRGSSLVVFPEGGISQTGVLRTMLPGAAMIALDAAATIVPVGITGTRDVLPYGAVWPRRRRGPVTIEFGAPIGTAEFESIPRRERLAAITERIEDAVRTMTNQPPRLP